MVTVAVLRGGTSPERSVSIRSGEGVVNALRSRGYEVLDVVVNSEKFEEVDGLMADVIFPVLHGGGGEDGTLQKKLEHRKIPFVGSGSQACSIAMDKLKSKLLFQVIDIPTPRGFVVSKSGGVDSARLNAMPFERVVVKPRDCGSSVGVSIVDKCDGVSLQNAISCALEHSNYCFIEEYIEGRELTVGILFDRALPVLEIVPPEGFYSYDAKYINEQTEYKLFQDSPARLDEIMDVALEAHNTIGCRDVSRVDIRYRNGVPYVLEVNSIPGMTERSLLPKAAAAVGYSYADLCENLVQKALARNPIEFIRRVATSRRISPPGR